jgi:hypothetical protein
MLLLFVAFLLLVPHGSSANAGVAARKPTKREPDL